MTRMMGLKKDVKEKRELVNIIIDRFLPRKDEYPKILHKAMRHTLFAGGKRIRPYLAITAYQLFGGTDQRILPAAASIELVHTYSLIHDDMPDIDNDDYRRGKPALHREFGEAIALLAADALLMEAFKFLLSVDTKPKIKAKLIQELAESAGCEGLVAGQVADIESEGKNVTEDGIDFIYRNKTAKLITTAVRFGALLAEAKPDDLARMTEFGKTIGILFQLTDDILDIEGTLEEIGKTPGKDEKMEKATYPLLFGLEKAKSKADQLLQEAQEVVSYYGDKAEFLKKISIYIATRKF